MITDILLFIHIISATAWVGGGLLLFGMGIYFKDPKVQSTIYNYIGPFYGYFQLIWIALLIITGLLLLNQFNLLDQLHLESFYNSEFGLVMWTKILLVLFVVVATTIHMTISLKAHGRDRTQKEKIFSRGTSLVIFILNFFIVWYAIQVEKFLG